MIENKKLKMSVKKEGYVSELIIKDDPYKMNWVIEDTYLQQAGYQDMDKLFGLFDITADGEKTGSEAVNPVIKEEQSKIEIGYDFEKFKVKIIYDLSVDAEALFWKIELENNIQKKIQITDFGIWVSFAYVMFRDKNVLRNIHNSAAVFPSISTDYTKLSMVRRDGTGTNLGLYQVKGKTKSVGTYCDYENLFFENVSPSLDGMLFHKLYLAGGYPQDFKNGVKGMSGDIISISTPPFPDFIEGNYRKMRKGQSHVDRKNLGFFDLIAVKKGCLFLEEDDRKYEIKENEMFILLPDRHHCSWKPCQEDTEFYWLHFYTTA